MQLGKLVQLVRRIFVVGSVSVSALAQTTFSCPSNQYVTTQLINTGQSCSALPPTVSSVTGATGGGLVVSTSGPLSAPVVSVAPDATHYLPTGADQTNWNSKQAAGSYLTGLAGDVTTTGAGAATVVGVNGAPVPTAGGLTTTSSSGRLVNMKPVAALFGFGDSFVAGAGATSAPSTGGFALLAADTPAPAFNYAVGGTTAPQIAANALMFFAPNPLTPSVTMADGGANDSFTFDTCGGAAGTACVKNYLNAMMALEAWVTIPYQFRQFASGAAGTGTWSGNSPIALYSTPLLTSQGTAMTATSAGATRTFTIAAAANTTKVGLTSLATNGGTGSYTVTVDGALQTDACSGTTTFSSGPCGGVALANATFGPSRQEFTVAPATSHTIVVTTTNANAVTVIAADTVPPVGTANTNAVFVMGVNSLFDGAGVYNSASAALAAQLLAEGLPVYFVDLRSGTPGVNTTTDVATAATTSCAASLLNNHPNDCGYAHMRDTIYNTERANGYQFSVRGGGGKTLQANGFSSPISVQVYATNRATAWSNFNFAPPNISNNVIGNGIDFYRDASQGIAWGVGMGQDVSSGLPWSNTFITKAIAPANGWFAVQLYDGSTAFGEGHYTTKWGVNVNNGNTFQVGSMTAPSVIDSGLTSGNCVQAAAGGLLTTTGSPCGSGGGATSPLALTSTAVGQIPLTVNGIAGQTADLLDVFPTAAGTKQVSVNSAGTLVLGNAGPSTALSAGGGNTTISQFGNLTTSRELVAAGVVEAASFATAQVTKTANYTAQLPGDRTVYGNAAGGSITITLPSAATFAAGTNGFEFVILKTDASANTVTIATTNSQTISGRIGGTFQSATTLVLSAQGACVRLQGNGSNWFIVGSN